MRPLLHFLGLDVTSAHGVLGLGFGVKGSGSGALWGTKRYFASFLYHRLLRSYIPFLGWLRGKDAPSGNPGSETLAEKRRV